MPAECPGNHGDEETTSVLRSLVSKHLLHNQVPVFSLLSIDRITDSTSLHFRTTLMCVYTLVLHFTINYYSLSQVLGFLKGVLKRYLVPLELWGSKYNRKVFYRHLRKFLQLRRRETVSVKQMCEGVKVINTSTPPPPTNQWRRQRGADGARAPPFLCFMNSKTTLIYQSILHCTAC